MTQIPHDAQVGPQSFGFLIQVLARALDTRMKEALTEIGVDTKMLANLMLLAREDGINQRAIGKRLNFPEYFTSRAIDSLVDAGFAERRADPDSRRSFLIFLTEAGKSKARELPPIIQKVNDEILDGLDTEERKQVVSLLQRVALKYVSW